MKVIQLNIERNKHLERFIPFLLAEQPDVVCLEEVMERTVPQLEDKLGMQATFAPMAILRGYEPDTEGDRWGICFLSRVNHRVVEEVYLVGSRDEIRIHTYKALMAGVDTIAKVLLVVEVEEQRSVFTLGMTHFTWAPNGQVSDLQEHDMATLEGVLDRYPKLILCGDFNIPRGNKLYERLAARFTDNVPSTVTTTIDQKLHRKTGLMYVVDYLFSTPHFTVTDIRVVDGVSDHCALVANVETAS